MFEPRAHCLGKDLSYDYCAQALGGPTRRQKATLAWTAQLEVMRNGTTPSQPPTQRATVAASRGEQYTCAGATTREHFTRTSVTSFPESQDGSMEGVWKAKGACCLAEMLRRRRRSHTAGRGPPAGQTAFFRARPGDQSRSRQSGSGKS